MIYVSQKYSDTDRMDHNFNEKHDWPGAECLSIVSDFACIAIPFSRVVQCFPISKCLFRGFSKGGS